MENEMKHAWKELIYGKKKYILIELLLILLMFMVLFLSGLVSGLGRAVSSAIDTMDAQYFITMVVWVLIIVSAVIIGIFNYILTLQKRRQYGVMKAIGMSSGELAGIIICEVLIISVFAAVISLVLTFAMAAAMPQTMPFYLEVSDAVTVTAAFVIISVLSSLLSVISISRIDPVTAIGGEE